MSKDVGTAFWLDSRPFHQQPPVTDVIDFVIVNNKLHAEFDSFKKKGVYPSLRHREVNPLVFTLQYKVWEDMLETERFSKE